MNDRMCNFVWNTFSDHLREMLHQMKKSNEFTDVTLVCADMRQFQAHNVVLSACSSVFESIINDLPQNSSVIYLRGIKHQEMESILDFMYLGVATFHQERMNEFLNVAKNLKIKGISISDEFDKQKKTSIESSETLANKAHNVNKVSETVQNSSSTSIAKEFSENLTNNEISEIFQISEHSKDDEEFFGQTQISNTEIDENLMKYQIIIGIQI